MSEIQVYARGPLTCSACAPNEMSGAEVAKEVTQQDEKELLRAGIFDTKPLAWKVADDTHFASGFSNPCPCNDMTDTRRHWLLEV